MPKKKGMEIGIEGALVLVAFLVDRAREWGDVRANVFWEYGCWAAIAGLLLGIFWIFPYAQKWKRSPKLAIVCLVPLLLVICNWQTARDKYYSQRSEQVIGLPSISIETQLGLHVPISAGIITPEMGSKYREHWLRITNTNSFDIRNFSTRLQVPEPIPECPSGNLIVS